jgi:hypothetical protein
VEPGRREAVNTWLPSWIWGSALRFLGHPVIRANWFQELGGERVLPMGAGASWSWNEMRANSELAAPDWNGRFVILEH